MLGGIICWSCRCWFCCSKSIATAVYCVPNEEISHSNLKEQPRDKLGAGGEGRLARLGGGSGFVLGRLKSGEAQLLMSSNRGTHWAEAMGDEHPGTTTPGILERNDARADISRRSRGLEGGG